MMRWFSILLFITVLIFTCETDSIGGFKEFDKSEPFISPASRGGGVLSFLCHCPGDYMFYADYYTKTLRVQWPDGSILEFNSEHLRKRNSIKEKAARDKSVIDEWFRSEPMLWGISNMKCFDKGVALFNREGVPGRGVQFLDNNLNVTRVWMDKTFRGALAKPEAVAINALGEIFATGEKGEMLKYDLNGNVIKRFVFPGVFNESRIVQPEPISEYEKRVYSTKSIEGWKKQNQYDAEYLTQKVAERDKILPKPIFLSGPEMPVSINAIEITSDNTILLMDDYKIYEIDQDSATIRPFDMAGVVYSEDEKLRGMRLKEDYLMVITEKRTLSIDITKNSLIGERERYQQLSYSSWDVIPPRTFLLASINKRDITEYVCPVPRPQLKSRRLSSDQLISKVIRLGEPGLEIRSDGLYYDPKGTEPFSGSVRVVNEKGDKEIITNYLYGMKEGEEIDIWDQSDGKVYTKRHYKDNILNGEYKKWEEGRYTWIQGSYKNGKLDGPYTEWTSHGRKKLSGTYKDGREDGLWTGWAMDGTKIFEVNYKQGRKFGLCLSWYPNGQKKQQYQFNEKGKDGEWLYWDEQGNITKKEVYKDAKLIESTP